MGAAINAGQEAFPPILKYLKKVATHLDVSVSVLRKCITYYSLIARCPILLLCPSADYKIVAHQAARLDKYLNANLGSSLYDKRPNILFQHQSGEATLPAAAPSTGINMTPILKTSFIDSSLGDEKAAIMEEGNFEEFKKEIVLMEGILPQMSGSGWQIEDDGQVETDGHVETDGQVETHGQVATDKKVETDRKDETDGQPADRCCSLLGVVILLFIAFSFIAFHFHRFG